MGTGGKRERGVGMGGVAEGRKREGSGNGRKRGVGIVGRVAEQRERKGKRECAGARRGNRRVAEGNGGKRSMCLYMFCRQVVARIHMYMWTRPTYPRCQRDWEATRGTGRVISERRGSGNERGSEAWDWEGCREEGSGNGRQRGVGMVGGCRTRIDIKKEHGCSFPHWDGKFRTTRNGPHQIWEIQRHLFGVLLDTIKG
jgi:hypothetical protein